MARHYTKAITFNVGKPVATWGVFATGKDPTNSALDYKVYSRHYQNALILYKPLAYTRGVSGKTTNDTATVHNLGGTYREVRADGTLGRSSPASRSATAMASSWRRSGPTAPCSPRGPFSTTAAAANSFQNRTVSGSTSWSCIPVASEAGLCEAGASESGASEAGLCEAGCAPESGLCEAGASEAGLCEAGGAPAP